MKKQFRTYAILSNNSETWKFQWLKNCYNASGKYLRSQFYSESDTYILAERTIDKNGAEYYSNFWSSNDLKYLRNRARRFELFYDYTRGYTNDKALTDGTTFCGQHFMWKFLSRINENGEAL